MQPNFYLQADKRTLKRKSLDVSDSSSTDKSSVEDSSAEALSGDTEEVEESDSDDEGI